MKNTLTALAAAALIAMVGCNSGTPGGPGADKAKEQANESKLKKLEDKIIQPENTFTLSTPTLSTSLKQSESKVVTLGIHRGKNFDENVTLKFEDLSKGVTIEPATPTIKKGDTETKVSVKAADDAALGDFTVKVIGHPDKGPDSVNTLKLTVKMK
jgi:hypothetical protein